MYYSPCQITPAGDTVEFTANTDRPGQCVESASNSLVTQVVYSSTSAAASPYCACCLIDGNPLGVTVTINIQGEAAGIKS